MLLIKILFIYTFITLIFCYALNKLAPCTQCFLSWKLVLSYSNVCKKRKKKKGHKNVKIMASNSKYFNFLAQPFSLLTVWLPLFFKSPVQSTHPLFALPWSKFGQSKHWGDIMLHSSGFFAKSCFEDSWRFEIMIKYL